MRKATTKEAVIMRDIVLPHHPSFTGKNKSSLRALARKSADAFNIELLVEQAMAHVGGLKWTPGNGSDFGDKSDCKTTSIRTNAIGGSSKSSYAGKICNVASYVKTLKSGMLRCVVYNPHTQSLMFYGLPKRYWKNKVTYGAGATGGINFVYNAKLGVIKEFDYKGFRVLDFTTLSRMNVK